MFSQTRGNVDLKWPTFLVPFLSFFQHLFGFFYLNAGRGGGGINTQKYNVLAFVENSFLTKITAKGTKLDKTGIFLFTWSWGILNTHNHCTLIFVKNYFFPKVWQARSKWASNSVHWISSLREKCPNTEFFLVRIFPHSDWMRRELFVFSPNAGEIRTRNKSVFERFSRSAWISNIKLFKQDYSELFYILNYINIIVDNSCCVIENDNFVSFVVISPLSSIFLVYNGMIQGEVEWKVTLTL